MQRVVAAQGAVAGGDLPKAITELRALRDDPIVKADQTTASLVDQTLAQTHVLYGNQLLDQGKLDDSYGQFAEALKLTPNDQEAQDGQKRVILNKNYGIMEANWGKDDDAAIKALEENMVIDAGFKDTRQKLYALLLGKADKLLAGGDRDGAFPVLMRALDVLPDVGEAQKRLASYTPTPQPQPQPQPTTPATTPADNPSRNLSRSLSRNPNPNPSHNHSQGRSGRLEHLCRPRFPLPSCRSCASAKP